MISVTDSLPLTFCPLSAGVLLWVPLSPGHHRLGGSALAQCYSQLGDCSPDLDQPELLTACFNTTQKLIHGQFAQGKHLPATERGKSWHRIILGAKFSSVWFVFFFVPPPPFQFCLNIPLNSYCTATALHCDERAT